MLSQLRRRHVRALFAVPLLAVFSAASCAETIVRPESTARSDQPDGIALYRGLMLGDGPVAMQVAQIRDHFAIRNFITDGDQLQAVGNIHDRIISAIQGVDPAFFARFEQAMRSGNHLRIEGMLREATDVTFEAVYTMAEGAELRSLQADPSRIEGALLDKLEQVNADNPRDTTRVKNFLGGMYADALGAKKPGGVTTTQEEVPVVAILAAIYIGLVMDVVVVVNVVGVYAVYKEAVVASKLMTDVQHDLVRERLIHSIAVQYAP